MDRRRAVSASLSQQSAARRACSTADTEILCRGEHPSAYENRHINETATLETHLLQPWREEILGRRIELPSDRQQHLDYTPSNGVPVANVSPLRQSGAQHERTNRCSNAYDAEFSPPYAWRIE